jgi:hypothetical protein
MGEFPYGTTVSMPLQLTQNSSTESSSWSYAPVVNMPLRTTVASGPGCLEIYAAQDFADGTSYFGVELKGNPYLMTAVELIPFGDLSARGIKLKNGTISPSRFSPDGILAYSDGRASVDALKLYTDISSYTSEHIFFIDPESLVVVVLYTIGTYFHCLYPSIGYLHLRGEKATGKTRCLSVLAPIVFNGEVSVSLHPQTLCQAINTNRSTSLWDEAQSFGRGGSKRYSDTINILKSGIYPDGQIVLPHRGTPTTYSTFGPKIFAGTGHLDPELADRTIEIPMMRNLSSERIGRFVQSAALKERQQQLRDQLYSFALTYGRVIAALRDTCAKEVAALGLEGRIFDIYYPIFLMSMFLDSKACTGRMEITDAVLGFAQHSKQRRQRRENIDNITIQLLSMVKDYLAENPSITDGKAMIVITTDDLFSFGKEAEYLSAHQTKSWLTRQLNDLGVDNRPAKVGGKCKRVYIIDVLDFEDRCRRSLPSEELL